MNGRSLHAFAPLLLLVFASLVLLAPVWALGKALFWGTPALQFVPWWYYAWQTLRAGHLPLWNPLLGMGAPLLANYQSALLYPPTWVYFGLAALGGLQAMAWGQAIMAALHLAWAGIGMALVVRDLKLGLLAQIVGGLAFGLSGYLVARAGFLSINAAAAWLPWLLLFSRRVIVAKRPRRPFWLLTLCTALQLLAGHAQTTWYTWLLLAAWSSYWYCLKKNEKPAPEQAIWPNANLRMVFLVIAMALAIGLAAVQLFPTGEYLLQSQRSQAVDFDQAMTYSFWPWRLLTLLAPDLFGSPVSGDYWGYGNYWEDALYIGMLPLLLAVGAVAGAWWGILPQRVEPAPQPGQTPRSLSFFLQAVVGLAVLLALGKNTPVFPWLYTHIPSFNLFQAPARFLLWAEVALAMLAALGAESWRRPQGRGLYWTRLGTAGAFAVSLGAGLAWIVLGGVSPTFIRATTLAGLWGLGAGLLSLAAPPAEHAEGRPFRSWPLAVTAWVLADLWLAGWGLNPGIGLDFYQPPPAAALPEGRLYLSAGDEYALKYARFFRFDTFSPGEDWQTLRAVSLPNLNLLNDLPSTNNFDPLTPGRYARWMEKVSALDGPAQADALQRMAVGVLEQLDPREPSGVSFSRVTSAGRWRLVPCARFVAGAEQAWERAWQPAGQTSWREAVTLEPGPAGENGSIPALCDLQASDKIRIIDVDVDNPNALQIRFAASMPGWLVIADTAYPGWRARLDGKMTKLYTADYIFRAVAVPAGEHVVAVEYFPWSFWSGLMVGLAAWSGFLFYAWKTHLA